METCLVMNLNLHCFQIVLVYAYNMCFRFFLHFETVDCYFKRKGISSSCSKSIV